MLQKHEIERITGREFTGGNSVELLWKGGESFERIFDTVRMARKLICVEFYIFKDDDTGRELAEILKEKAAEGVCVYVIYDHFGSIGTSLGFWQSLREAGVKVRPFNPLRIRNPGAYFTRDHKKLIIIDGVLAFTGGLNIANEYRGFIYALRKTLPGQGFFGYEVLSKEPWRDTGIIITGPAARRLLRDFKRTWRGWGGKAINTRFGPIAKETAAGLSVVPIFAHSKKGRRRLRSLLYYAIRNSEKEIMLTTAYFTPGRRLIRVLSDAVDRGVRVRLLSPGISDVPAAYYAGRAFFSRLLRAGVEIYAYRDIVLHAKTYVFDSVFSIVGSANLDSLSLRWNDEGNVGIYDRGFGRKMKQLFESDLTMSEKIQYEKWRKRPLCEKLQERFYSYFRKRL